jgi:hypothetical protein
MKGSRLLSHGAVGELVPKPDLTKGHRWKPFFGLALLLIVVTDAST